DAVAHAQSPIPLLCQPPIVGLFRLPPKLEPPWSRGAVGTLELWLGAQLKVEGGAARFQHGLGVGSHCRYIHERAAGSPWCVWATAARVPPLPGLNRDRPGLVSWWL